MRIPCPYCQLRSIEEFYYLGDAAPAPQPDAGENAWLDFVYDRRNPRGLHEELWFHTNGCRQWLRVCRNTANHQIISVTPARPSSLTQEPPL